ncbi:inosine 5-monophosphate dehydrogenase [Coriobacteriaceae bacterium BV3Ac1]|uniref:IMP dehydrogenase n=1 Tax=Olegusella massiliensis TaxID=1776381 RepID=UPI0003AE6ED0|nr:IMP dehydrogenase [Olegusella massiliensis]ERL12708.1 inosine 5-monophosphate dehydrogenase [Coriobacteriaceae bacterium BV3Ac1]
MATFIEGVSHTFSEYLLVPGYSSCENVPNRVSLKTPLVKYRRGEEPAISMNIPMTSAIMQSVSGTRLAVALAQEGGVSFIYGSQSAESEAAMVREVKEYKAGFVISDSTLLPDMTLQEVMDMREQTGHSTMPVTDDGTAHGHLLGIVTSRDYRPSRDSRDTLVRDFMTPRERVIVGDENTTLKTANDIIWDNKLNQLPIVDADGHLIALVFRKDYDSHKGNPGELLDSQKRYIVGAGINTRDYAERVPLLVDAGADVLCIDSSEGFSEWQKITLEWVREHYGDSVKVGAGNVVDSEGFRFLADAGADFIKVGIGGGSICITREQKGIGRGQASALIDVCRARDEYFEKTGVYIPVCSDGGIVYDYHMTLALAMGADFLMLGRYFARFDESPTRRVNINGSYMKEYWGEGSARARNWARYDLGGNKKNLSFVEGVDSYVPYAGPLKENVDNSLLKVRSTMCNCGALTLEELRDKAKITLVSSTSLVEGGAHDVVLKDANKENVNFRS